MSRNTGWVLCSRYRDHKAAAHPIKGKALFPTRYAEIDDMLEKPITERHIIVRGTIRSEPVILICFRFA